MPLTGGRAGGGGAGGPVLSRPAWRPAPENSQLPPGRFVIQISSHGCPLVPHPGPGEAHEFTSSSARSKPSVSPTALTNGQKLTRQNREVLPCDVDVEVYILV